MSNPLLEGGHVPIYILLQGRILKLGLEEEKLVVENTPYSSLPELLKNYKGCNRLESFDKPQGGNYTKE